MKSMALPNISASLVTTESTLRVLMEDCDCHDMQVEINEAGQKRIFAEKQCTVAFAQFLEKPSFSSKNQLSLALQNMQDLIQKEYDHAIIQQRKYVELAKLAATSKKTWHEWLFNIVQYFFDSTTEQQTEKYKAIAENRQKILQQLLFCEQQLQLMYDSEGLVQNPQFPAILQSETVSYPIGFKILGEKEGDWSGYSVSSAGDINDDGRDDIFIGANQFYSYGNGEGGYGYIIFGEEGMGSSGDIKLADLNGRNGLKILAENPGDRVGSSVSMLGDINGDNFTDIVISAPAYPKGYEMGCSYILFGQSGFGNGNPAINLTNFNVVKGVKLCGENNYDHNGISIASAGDINGDGNKDLVIGAYEYPGGVAKGRTYIVFGGSWITGYDYIALGSLNGTHGFIIEGENNGDWSGVSVSAVKDVNGDGYDDLIIGAYGYPQGINSSGCSYVIFGGREIGKNGLFSLTDLNGENGFKIYGENNGDYSGYRVSGLGDINEDGIADLAIGAEYGSKLRGAVYLVFGSTEIGHNGALNLSSLNGNNGVKLIGEQFYDRASIIKSAGDFNDDGCCDLMIGAVSHPGIDMSNGGPGRVYLLFNIKDANNGLINLTSLNGTDGFKIDGENPDDCSGYAINTAGDINNDGIIDILIGAFNYSNGTGKTYLIYGDAAPVLVNNNLVLSAGSSILLNSDSLAAYDHNHNNDTLVFIPEDISHGRFEIIDVPDVAVVNFTQQQIISGMIRFIHDGSPQAPQYSISVRSDGMAWNGPSPAQIYFTATNLNPRFSTPIIVAMILGGVFGALMLYCLGLACYYRRNRITQILSRTESQELARIFPDASLSSNQYLLFSANTSNRGTRIDHEPGYTIKESVEAKESLLDSKTSESESESDSFRESPCQDSYLNPNP